MNNSTLFTGSFPMTKLVISFNRHFFAVALVACLIGIGLSMVINQWLISGLLLAGAVLALYFVIVSVMASYVVYDRSDLYKLTWWPKKYLPQTPQKGVLLHAGFDPTSHVIQQKYPDLDFTVFDFFNSGDMTEASIQIAHRLFPPPADQKNIEPGAWPVESNSQDVVFMVSAAHELRKRERRAAFFQEAKRVLNENGRIIVIEQLRDLPNFLCFGAAAFHFLSNRTWRQTFADADLTVVDEGKITPFMHIYTLQ
ncbi:MAG: class I SAM-dependent methyltransferase [Chloroflexota bacterium]